MNQKVAVPLTKGSFCIHFGECDQFVIFEISDKEIIHKNYLVPPPHKPGVFPRWLANFGVTHVFAGGMGHRAMDHFQHYDIACIFGIEPKPIMELIHAFMNDQLKSGMNLCHHHHHHH